ncbi:hypothetical protein CHUAL_002141 [Chamberlinius hualienensis]
MKSLFYRKDSKFELDSFAFLFDQPWKLFLTIFFVVAFLMYYLDTVLMFYFILLFLVKYFAVVVVFLVYVKKIYHFFLFYGCEMDILYNKKSICGIDKLNSNVNQFLNHKKFFFEA